MSKILIRAMVLPMTGPEDFYPEGEIGIENDRILFVGEKGSAPDSFIPDQIIDLPEDVVMPGLINTHTHAAMTMLRSYADDLPLMPWLQTKIWPFEDKMSDEDIYWGTLLALGEMIQSGTTTMLDMYASMDQVAKAVLEAGTRGVLSRGLIGNAPNGERAFAENMDLVKNYHGAGQGRIQVMFGPHAPYTCSGEFLQRVKQEADRLGVGIHIHVAETEDEIKTIKEQYGKTPVQWLEELGLFGGHVVAAHCVHLTEEDQEIMAQNKVFIAHNPESNMKLNSGTAPIPELRSRGVVVGLGTDGTSSNNNLDMFGEMRSAAFQQKLVKGATALPAYEVLQMATVDGARTLGLHDVGVLAPGYKADLISINFDQPHFYPRFSIPAHLVYVAHAGDVRTVMVDGKILMQERQLMTIDIKRVCREVEKRAKGIAQGL
ncbi:amidohydrolase [Desulfitobacterium hafniense DCB-2]|uniref:5-methylthioadenosine/S-adenosylhomocysteine deaminase n=1 Tax=Desulfitobacterium hafniense (strain DSM 10664 / DCB-2) TaxID=272564 RepID=MTAD_DESHD|nr:amidohydrolase [Desulfitobacterium hafniense]B8FRL9.1 RecName: Full=5-methylthioadenosine/S-adenosylhomocysteine deaminase; Short=MTA/SAH deaminase [Desulfitobacterium hafniense DCB-2]ACL21779.1 amidohydrolase [Desulfitobacterium hafniense DCB-2]